MIKQHSPETQVVMISGQQDFDVARQVLRERALDYLVKPFSQEEVIRVARQGISSYFHAVHQNQSRLEAQRRMTDLVLLRKVGETASSGSDLQQLFDQILDSIVHSAGVEVASLMLIRDDGQLHIASAHGLAKRLPRRSGSHRAKVFRGTSWRPASRFWYRTSTWTTASRGLMADSVIKISRCCRCRSMSVRSWLA